MKASLRVKDFGPIRNVDLELRNVNVFIGPQASGKSALAKLYTICKSPLRFFDPSILQNPSNNPIHVDTFKKTLEEFNILSFLNSDSLVEFDSELHYFKFEKEKVYYDAKFRKKIDQLIKHRETSLEIAKNDIIDILAEFQDKLFNFAHFFRKLFNQDRLLSTKEFKAWFADNVLTPDLLQELIANIKSTETDLSSNAALYIPSERNFIPIIKGATLNLLNNNVPIPKHLLSFGAEFEKATYDKKELDLDFLKEGLKYKNENGIDYIFYSSDKSIKLTESASGLQSAVPLILPILSKREKTGLRHNSFVIEEPELNLFPKAQYELIKVLEKDRFLPMSQRQDVGTIHLYTTHSPYILSAFNNILYAGIVRSHLEERIKNEKNLDWRSARDLAEDKIKSILSCFLEEDYFSAYQISDGAAESIFDRNKGLIKENFIDKSSDEMNDDFDALMELMNKEL